MEECGKTSLFVYKKNSSEEEIGIRWKKDKFDVKLL